MIDFIEIYWPLGIWLFFVISSIKGCLMMYWTSPSEVNQSVTSTETLFGFVCVFLGNVVLLMVFGSFWFWGSSDSENRLLDFLKN